MVVAWASEGLGQLAAGSSVWYRLVTKANPDAPWVLGTLVAVGEDDVQVQTLGRKPQVETVPIQNAEPANPDALSSVPDLTSLSHLNEPAILCSLAQRYEEDVIYTTAGPVLIAVNPCKRLPLYESATVDEYRKVQSDLDAQGKKPHIFLNAGKAFRDMVDNQVSQSMVISGESGAGKTETTKKAMQFFAQMSGGHGIEDQVLQTNPLLEAFGNSKTLRNHNSSRFGKLLEIHFNKSNHICGAKISTYLLEKSRVVHQIPGERSFHIFYQFLRGSTPQEAADWKLPKSVESFKYLSGPGAVTEIDGVDDAKDFKEVRDAMTAVNISKSLQHSMFSIVSAVLWLGNVTFTAKSDDETGVNKDEAFDTVCELLGIPPDKLEFALTHRLMTVGNETYEKPLNHMNALDTRDALAKALYAALFTFIVDLVNKSLATEKRLSGKFISILDIYGFESFTKNSFEQLCINYANERLQQQFNKHLFKLEQEEYDAEGIDWSHIDFVDNQDCLDTIDAKPPKGLGVMSVLDDQCNFPRSTDRSFSETIRERIKTGRFSYKPGPHMDFIIDHYAGKVKYDCAGFLDKNRDTLSVDLVSALEAASAEVVKAMLPYVAVSLEGKNKATVASRFKEQLIDLVSRLDETEMHFVRCIKPNFHLEPDKFDQNMILQQLRCCGVLEVVRIAKAGYPTRYVHKVFVKRYIELMPKAAVVSNNVIKQCEALLGHFRVPDTMWQLGHTKIFFKAGVLGTMEDLWRRTRGAVLIIQAQIRMFLARRRFLKMRAAVTTIAARRKGLVQRRKFTQDLKEHRAAIEIQRHARGLLARRVAAKRAAGLVTLQCGLKRWLLRRRCARREADMKQALEFAQNRALRAQDKLHSMEQQLNEWVKIKEEFEMSGEEIRGALKAWRDGGASAEVRDAPPAATNGSAAAGLSDQDAHDLKLFQTHREAFFAWQMGSGVGGEISDDEERELQVWRAHRAQFFKWQQAKVDGTNGASHAVPSGASQPQVRALTLQLEEYQQKCSDLQAMNAALRKQPGSGNVRPQRADPTREPVKRLQSDFQNRTSTMDDDLNFIQEVVTGASTAIPDFVPEEELRKLKHSFDKWKETFKTRMRDTYSFVKRASYQRARISHNPGPRNNPSYPRHHQADLMSPRSMDSSDSQPENVVHRMQEGFKKGAGAVKGVMGKLSRRMSSMTPEDRARMMTPQGSLDQYGGDYPPNYYSTQ